MYEVEHTAEHVFIRALQNLGKDILVRKVEHGEINKTYVECDDLTLDEIYKAECITNDIIDKGRQIKEHIFNSLDEAKERFPNLRAYEERLANNIRVIEIDGYDYTACIKDHVKNTRECEFFLIKHISMEKNIYEIEFFSGREAKRQALEFGIICLRLINNLQVSMKTLEATVNNMKRDLEFYKRSRAILSAKILENMNAVMIDNIRLYKGRFELLDNKTIMRKAGELSKDSIVLISNKSSEKCVIVLTSNLINCSLILSNVLKKVGGKGGGKDTFATGSIPSSKEDECLDLLEENIKTQIYKRY